MVDIVLLQSASYVAAAIGVCVAAFYYALNLRETTRNRRATFTTNLMQTLYSKEGFGDFFDLVYMKWDNFDDFLAKYDSANNRENCVKRVSYWSRMETIGTQYRLGLLDRNTMYRVCGEMIANTWAKFKPVIDEYKKRGEFTADSYSNWELMANEMAEIMRRTNKAWAFTPDTTKKEDFEYSYK
ncbi:MAG: hypothetical protein ABSA11_12130 [Candidatus Bathyarchaeia archaeon]|jgi:hypothetical protein